MPALDQQHRIDTGSLDPSCSWPWACQTLTAQCWLRVSCLPLGAPGVQVRGGSTLFSP